MIHLVYLWMRGQSDGLMVNSYDGFFYIFETNINEQFFQKQIIYKKSGVSAPLVCRQSFA